MFDFKSLFADWREEDESRAADERTVEQSAAVLLMELARADGVVDRTENEQMERMLQTVFGVDEATAHDLVVRARQESAEAVSLQPYTQALNDLLDADQKRELLISLWDVAHADGRVDGREEYTIRKICGLLNLRHRDFIQAKLAVAYPASD